MSLAPGTGCAAPRCPGLCPDSGAPTLPEVGQGEQGGPGAHPRPRSVLTGGLGVPWGWYLGRREGRQTPRCRAPPFPVASSCPSRPLGCPGKQGPHLSLGKLSLEKAWDRAGFPLSLRCIRPPSPARGSAVSWLYVRSLGQGTVRVTGHQGGPSGGRAAWRVWPVCPRGQGACGEEGMGQGRGEATVPRCHSTPRSWWEAGSLFTGPHGLSR